jgi:hypothetical protein
LQHYNEKEDDMSSITILQEYDKFTYFVDTATCTVVNDTIYRIEGINANKVYSIGKDVIFASGAEPMNAEMQEKIINSMLDESDHIKVSEFQRYLKQIYTFSFEPGDRDIRKYYQVGYAIMGIKNGRTFVYGLKQALNHFEIVKVDTPPYGTLNLVTDGYDNDFLYDKIIEYNKANYLRKGQYDIVGDVFETYEKHYSEGVGGEIRMYSFDRRGANLTGIKKLVETGLRTVAPGINCVDGKMYTVNIYINGKDALHAGNIGTYAAPVSHTHNELYSNSYSLTWNGAKLIPWNYQDLGDSVHKFGTLYAASGTINTSDRDKKNTIQDLDDRYLELAKAIMPKSFKMNEGTSGRTHVGFIAQEVEAAMTACVITDMEFAGLIKSPIYSKKLTDQDGVEIDEYDTSSEIIGYSYGLRYDEFIPLLLARIIELDQRLKVIEQRLGI